MVVLRGLRPVEGAANAEVVDILAEILGVRRGAVTIVSGHHSRRKRVAVAGIRTEDAARAFTARGISL